MLDLNCKIRIWGCIAFVLVNFTSSLTHHKEYMNLKRSGFNQYIKLINDNMLRTISPYKEMRGSEIFNHLLSKLSLIFLSNNLPLNLLFIGACDGTHDRTIEWFYKYPHWRGIFVEPVSYNFQTLVDNIIHHNVTNRALAIRAAMSNICKERTINITYPDFFTRLANAPHWIIRQTATLNRNVIMNMERARRLVSYYCLYFEQKEISELFFALYVCISL
jgi:hypothetical protein